MYLKFVVFSFVMLSFSCGSSETGNANAEQEQSPIVSQKPEKEQAPSPTPDKNETTAAPAATEQEPTKEIDQSKDENTFNWLPRGRRNFRDGYFSGHLPEKISAPSSDQTSHKLDEHLFVIMGGYHSCQFDIQNVTKYDNNVFGRFLNSIETIDPSFDGDYIFTCYHNRQRRISFYTSLYPDSKIQFDEGDLVDQIKSISKGRPLVYVGHSMGGWLSLKSAVATIDSNSIDYLATIDPISPVNCRIPYMASCLHAPNDFTQEQFNLLRNNIGRWNNYFQTQSRHIHSSRMDAAHYNTKLPMEHSQMDSSLVVWDDFIGFFTVKKQEETPSTENNESESQGIKSN